MYIYVYDNNGRPTGFSLCKNGRRLIRPRKGLSLSVRNDGGHVWEFGEDDHATGRCALVCTFPRERPGRTGRPQQVGPGAVGAGAQGALQGKGHGAGPQTQVAGKDPA